MNSSYVIAHGPFMVAFIFTMVTLVNFHCSVRCIIVFHHHMVNEVGQVPTLVVTYWADM